MVDVTVGGEMSRQAFSIAYSGAGRTDDHSIDVEALAPALLAFGRLIREGNSEFNGNKSTAKVLVSSDFENKCFHIDFEAIISFYHTVKTFLGFDEVKTAKEVLEWIGLIKDNKDPVAVGAITFLQYLRWRQGRPVTTSTTDFADHEKGGVVRVSVEGERNSVTITHHVYNLSVNSKALRATRDAFTPVGQDGFENVELRDGDTLIETITPEDTQRIIASCNAEIGQESEIAPGVEVTTAWLSVYSPVYDPSAKRWRFKLGAGHEYVDISQTRIAEDALTRGGAMVNDSYQVRLEITTPVGRGGKPGSPSYKILEVIKFVPDTPARQGSLFDGQS